MNRTQKIIAGVGLGLFQDMGALVHEVFTRIIDASQYCGESHPSTKGS